jgi:hypothetical protein
MLLRSSQPEPTYWTFTQISSRRFAIQNLTLWSPLSRSRRGLRIGSTLPLLSLEESRSPQFAFVLVLFLIRAPVTHAAYRITSLGAGFLVFAEGQEEVIAYRALTHTRDVGAVESRQEFSERVYP